MIKSDSLASNVSHMRMDVLEGTLEICYEYLEPADSSHIRRIAQAMGKCLERGATLNSRALSIRAVSNLRASMHFVLQFSRPINAQSSGARNTW